MQPEEGFANDHGCVLILCGSAWGAWPTLSRSFGSGDRADLKLGRGLLLGGFSRCQQTLKSRVAMPSLGHSLAPIKPARMDDQALLSGQATCEAAVAAEAVGKLPQRQALSPRKLVYSVISCFQCY